MGRGHQRIRTAANSRAICPRGREERGGKRGFGRTIERSQSGGGRIGGGELEVRGRRSFGQGFEGRCFRWQEFRGGLGTPTEALQLSERAIVRALGGIDAALQAREAIRGAAVDFADGSVLILFGEHGFAGLLDLVSPGFCFEAGKALEEPIGADEGIDEESFEVSGGSPVVVITLSHRFQLGRIFARNHLSLGIDAGLERVETGDGLALRSARARRELRIPTIRLYLTKCGHTFFPLTE